MEFERARPFMETHHRGVISTQRSDGAAHSSIVVCGAYEGNAAFVSVYPRSQKIRNLRRNPNCTVLCVSDDWRSGRQSKALQRSTTMATWTPRRPA